MAVTTAARVRRAARDLDAATARRDAAMAAMRDEGASLRQIADAAGLTHVGVLKALRRYDEAATAS